MCGPSFKGEEGVLGGGGAGVLDDGADSLTWRGEEPHKSPVASAECHTPDPAPHSERRIFLFHNQMQSSGVEK